MKNNELEQDVKRLLGRIYEDEKALRMRRFIQHGTITTYDHCISVAVMSLRINRFFRALADEEILVKGAFLHDYFLYDWHKRKVKFKNVKEFFKLHGFTHPEMAAKNAKRDFGIGEKEEKIISSHMWPLTFTKPPRSKEAIIVCIADKIISTKETIFRFNVN